MNAAMVIENLAALFEEFRRITQKRKSVLE